MQEQKNIVLDVGEIAFSQAYVSDRFSDGRSLLNTIQSIVSGALDPDNIEKIRVIKFRGRWYSLNNRRLRVFKTAFVKKITAIVEDFKKPDIKREFYNKFDNKTVLGGGKVILSAQFQLQKKLQSDAGEHFDSAAYAFTRKILSWPLEILESPLSKLEAVKKLPTSYESWELRTFKTLILEESRAIMQAGLEANPANIEMVLREIKLSRNCQNPCQMDFTYTELPKDVRLQANDVLALAIGDHQRVLAMTSYVPESVAKMMSLRVILDEDIRESTVLELGQKFRAVYLGSLVTASRMFAVCYEATELMREACMGETTEPESTDCVEFSRLNTSQAEALNRFINIDSGIQMIQGPPGTGKTTTVVELLSYLSEQKKRCLVCAPSNKAVQVLIERFLRLNVKTTPLLAGVEDKLPPDSPEIRSVFLHTWRDELVEKMSALLDDLLACHPDMHREKLHQEIQGLQVRCGELIAFIKAYTKLDSLGDTDLFGQLLTSKDRSAYIAAMDKAISKLQQINHAFLSIHPEELEAILLANSQIIFSTLSVSGRKSMRDYVGEIDVLIIDEASQAVEAESLIPMILDAEKCLLIGDTKQLPATVISQAAKEKGFERSLMMRLEENGMPKAMLKVQYRMDPAIRQWPSSQFYKDKLRDGKNVIDREPITPLLPLSFFDVVGKETKRGKSIANPLEANSVVKMLKFIRQNTRLDLAKQVGVITFYAGQVEEIRNCMQKSGIDMPHLVQTVDSYQGDEREVILISCVRSGEKNIGFLRDFRRLNVAITRAMHHLVLFGNCETLQSSHSAVADMVENYQERGLIFTQKHFVDKYVPQQACKFFKLGKPKSCFKGSKCQFKH